MKRSRSGPGTGGRVGPGPAHPAESGDGTRARLVAAASELLAEGGPDAVTLRAVGARTGVSRTAPYRHFKDKDHLLSAVAARSFGVLHDEVRAAVQAGGGPAGPLDALERGCVAYIRAGLARPRHYQLMFRDAIPFDDSGESYAAAGVALKYFDELLAACRRAGHVRAGEGKEQVIVLWGTLHGLVDLSLTGRLHTGKVDVSASASRLVRVLLDGLRP
ncbi:TetR/AcrR family transcriptional regulator [Allonocardiopsis opalescens]|uniref:TetR family transcriptional regulator n=1 Tax=Allonocardiopsis opalescens TaxID=1144618 RepID=A0A2T0PTD1_9ACTN|nr:TetR/AcrR family transcriptional regulator [Allonocardiopsis opalescens]PRX92153.1 TetR family transcriptional regulator [Allonocardiopsis opalescens]